MLTDQAILSWDIVSANVKEKNSYYMQEEAPKFGVQQETTKSSASITHKKLSPETIILPTTRNVCELW